MHLAGSEKLYRLLTTCFIPLNPALARLNCLQRGPILLKGLHMAGAAHPPPPQKKMTRGQWQLVLKKIGEKQEQTPPSPHSPYKQNGGTKELQKL